MLSVVILDVIMMIIVRGEHHNQTHYAECRYAELHRTECRCTEPHYAECRGALQI
jgi:hypothetical protein